MNLHVTKYGAKIRVKEGVFQVRYFDKKKQQQLEEFAPSQLSTIWVYFPVSLSVAVLQLANQHQINVIFMDEKGQPLGRFDAVRPNTTSKIQKAQAIIASQPNLSYPIAERWIKEKIQNQIQMLQQLLHKRVKPQEIQLLQKAINSIQTAASKIPLPSSESFTKKCQTLRGIEGATSRTFFYALNQLLATRYQFKKRSRPAQDAFNAYLNYAFALLYSKVEIALVGTGLNPHIGLMHRDGYQLKSMVYDFIEPFRVGTIWVVFQQFIRERVNFCLLYTSPSPRDATLSRMPSSA